MPTTLTYGRKVPVDGERGFWDSLEDNITRDDSHDHDGTNSKLINTADLDKDIGSITAVGWAATSGGTYKQTITVPTGHTVNKMLVKFYVDGGGEDGHQIHPSIQKVTATTYDIFINDNTVALKAVYG